MIPIQVKTAVNLPVSKVWDYWTKTEHITQWNAASPDWHCPKATNDLKKGGRFSYIMAARDSSASFDFSGTYTSVIPGIAIGYVMDDGRKVKVSFETVSNNTTEITETFDPESENSPDLQQSGWQSILDNFREYAEKKG